jgi:hypothetical protein
MRPAVLYYPVQTRTADRYRQTERDKPVRTASQARNWSEIKRRHA